MKKLSSSQVRTFLLQVKQYEFVFLDDLRFRRDDLRGSDVNLASYEGVFVCHINSSERRCYLVHGATLHRRGPATRNGACRTAWGT